MRKYTIILALILFALPLFTQQEIPVWKKLRYLSEEEMYLEVRSARDFTETDPPAGKIRNVAEFDPMQGVLVRYPFGVPVTLLKEIAKDDKLVVICADENEEAEVITTFENYAVNLDNCSFLYAQTDSWWVRDYGPWFVFDGQDQPGIVDFPYNRPRPLDNNIPAAVADYLDIDLYGMNILHTGGNYMTDGLGKSSSTDLILEENPAMTEAEVDNKFREYLAIEDYYVLEDPLDDYIKHIDCWGKFLTPGKVIIGQVAETDYRYEDYEAVADFFKNTISGYGVPYEVYRVFTPGGNDLTPYTNSLIVNDKVFVPISGSDWDDEALQVYEEALPGYEIIGIFHWGWYNTDALHCRTKGIADLGMLYIDHLPVLGEQAFSSHIDFTADITACSGMEIYSDSTFLNYSINDEPLQQMKLTENMDGQWVASLDELNSGDEVSYYLSTTDHSGRTTMHPFIGPADPHEFTVGAFVSELSTQPDTLVFDSYDKLTNGLEATVNNLVAQEVSVTGFTLPNQSDYIIGLSNIPSLPFHMEPAGSFAFTVYFNEPLPEMGSYFIDSILVQTPNHAYPVYFMVDRTGVNTQNTGMISTVKVYPTPADDRVNFEFTVSESGDIVLSIFNASGQLVYQKSQQVIAGENRLSWDRIENSKNVIPSGKYFYKLTGEQIDYTGKIVFE